MEDVTPKTKSEKALQEEEVLEFWKIQNIFSKTLSKEAQSGDFIFYEGPPTANAKPALHHLEARAFKDVIPRYKTMQGYHVERRAGWDTHGLPVELQIEKKLGLTSKKQIEEYGVAKFNKECKESVFTYIKDWEDFTDRMGYWVEKKSAYYTFNNEYIESLWNIVGKINDRGLLYKDYKVVPWCPRCGTGLSSHELAQGYQDDKDLTLTAKFKVVGQENTYILAWTTTPWTLLGNVALAVGAEIEYVWFKKDGETFIIAEARKDTLGEEYEVIKKDFGKNLVGLKYEPLYPYLKNELSAKNIDSEKAFQVYTADFVTTTDGTGVVHIAPMYGADDFDLGTKIGLPKMHTVDESGHFMKGSDFLEGRFVKDEDVAVDIIKDLAHRNLLVKKEKYEHSYPHCWRCNTSLLYYARDSWYVQMSKLRDDLLKANETINWEPSHIKEGRFGEWLREVKDWAFSRERYWGTPLPVWSSEDGERLVVDSLETLKKYQKSSGNTYHVIRHGQAVHNLTETWSCVPGTNDELTQEGREQVQLAAQSLKEKVDIIITSPFIRGQETAKIIADVLGITEEDIIVDSRIGEWNVGAQFNGQPMDEYFVLRNEAENKYTFKLEGGESYADVFKRSGEFLYEIEEKYKDKKVLIVSHGGSARAMELVAVGNGYNTNFGSTQEYRNFKNAEIREISFVPLPHNDSFELDLHKPYIDDVELYKDGKKMARVNEVIDVWFDSGSMPFAQSHYPFNKELLYPADFISEAIDQTRGWFYTMLAVGVLMEKGTPYKNVICLGHLLDKNGKKMSKSLGNIINPFEQMDQFGVDAMRWWMYSVNAPGESKNYDEKSVAEINNKIFNLFGNVLSFYELYRDISLETSNLNLETTHVLDQWIIARLNQLITEVTKSLDSYDLFRPTRAMQEFIGDLSTWYLRRSRDRIKDGDKEAKQTLHYVLKTTAQIIAPFAPFFAEQVWQKLKNSSDEESVHLSQWPAPVESGKLKAESIIEEMEKVREVVTKGLELRQKAGIKIRQPLASLKVESGILKEEYYEIVQDELNVKNILEGEEMSLDTDLTPELKAEGIARELMRAIQDMRKQKGLKPEDVIELTIGTSKEGRNIIQKFEADIAKTVGASSVKIVENESGEVIIENIPFSISF